MNEHAFSPRSSDPKNFMTYEKGRTRIRRVVDLPGDCKTHVLGLKHKVPHKKGAHIRALQHENCNKHSCRSNSA